MTARVTTRGRIGLGLLLLGTAAGAALWLRAEGAPPRVEAPASLLLGSTPRSVTISLSDAEAGLRELRVLLTHPRGEAVLLEEHFPGNLLAGGGEGSGAAERSLSLDARALGLVESDGFLRIEVSDWSWRRGFGGNQTQTSVPVHVDLSPPRIDVASGLTYVRRGGAGAVAYAVSEATARDGVLVGEDFYRGFPAGAQGRPGGRVALFAVATHAPPDPTIRIIAEDAAGNRARASWPVVVQPRPVRNGNVTLPAAFLERTVRPLAEAEKIPASNLAAAFRTINTKLRSANEARIRALLAESAGEELWRGPFQQLANSKATSPFAEHRLYFVDGAPVSEATHYGYDLASRAAAPVTASNRGRVVFAGRLGIYGNCVLIDHGLGLASLYGHLSRLDVAAGDRVGKGQTLGRSGATGLAGGDHLHFAMLVGGTYVDPLEWWDPAWVRTHIDARLGAASPASPASR